MKPKITAVWLVIAAMLFAFIWFYQKHLRSVTAPDLNLIAGLRPADVTGVEIYPTGAPELSATLTNGGWELEKPFAYPAQTAAIEALLESVADLKPLLRFSAAEMSSHKNADAEFGFDDPQYSIVITAGDQQWQLRVGNKTAPGDGVYVRVVGLDGAFVTGTDWLQLLPHDAADWRDTSLMDVASDLDWITITNGTRAIELRRDPTNRLWRLTYPLQARADNLLIATALQQLRSTHISRFVTDDPKADPTTYGLQPPALDLRLGEGTNLVLALQAGKSPDDSPTQVYARREGWNSVVTIPNDTLAAWRGAVNGFRDPHLVDLTAPVAQIEVHGKYDFTLQDQGSNHWVIAGKSFPVDADEVVNYLRQLTRLRVSEFEKDVVTTKDLQDFGLAPPAQMEQITLRAVDTNNVIAQLTFGAVETNKVFVKRSDEGFVYAVTPDDFRALPQADFEFRDQHIWNFSETNVAQITLRENQQTRVLLRTGANDWSLAPGSQGVINTLATEETVHQLGLLTTLGTWLGHSAKVPDRYGFKPDNLSVTVYLKTGEKLPLDFGLEIPQLHTAVAAVTLGDGCWTFVFPPATYQLVAAYLTIPPTPAP